MLHGLYLFPFHVRLLRVVPLLVMMILSLTAFLLLHYLPLTRPERVSSSPSSTTTFNNILQQDNQEDNSEDNPDESEGSEVTLGVVDEGEEVPQYSITSLLVVQCLVCCLSNGALPSIQSYSCLPYGNTVYHFAVTLNAMANPLMAFLAFFLPCTKPRLVYSLTVGGCVLSGYILTTALFSPGMVGSQVVGGGAVVLTWLTTGAVFSYVKVCVAGICRTKGPHQLFITHA